MATKSFLKSISVQNKNKADCFVRALENAENKGRKRVVIKERAQTISNKEKIKKIFGV